MLCQYCLIWLNRSWLAVTDRNPPHHVLPDRLKEKLDKHAVQKLCESRWPSWAVNWHMRTLSNTTYTPPLEQCRLSFGVGYVGPWFKCRSMFFGLYHTDRATVKFYPAVIFVVFVVQMRANALCTRFYSNPAPVIRFMQFHYCTVSNPGTGADDAFVSKHWPSRNATWPSRTRPSIAAGARQFQICFPSCLFTYSFLCTKSCVI